MIFQSWSEEKILRLEYVVTNCDFSVMERGEGTKTGVGSHKLRFFQVTEQLEGTTGKRSHK